MIDLEPEHLKLVQRILAEHVPDAEVRVFGSRVQGKSISTSLQRLIEEKFEIIQSGKQEHVR